MGILFKIFLFILVISFIFNQLGRFFLKKLFRQFEKYNIEAEEKAKSKQKTYRSKKDNIEIEYISKEAKEKQRKGSNFKGGDYIDFEDV